MNQLSSLLVQCVKFDKYKDDISFIRNKVFIQEQKIPKELEWDLHDNPAWHYIIKTTDAGIIAYARLLPSGKLGRVAVLKQWRRQGIGSKLITTICKNAVKYGIDTIYISSQSSAVNFYNDLGFQLVGEIFFEAGIEHQSMIKNLK